MNIKNESGVEIIQYDNLEEFYDYLCKTPFNKAFSNCEKHSLTASESFTKTKSFDEAVDLLKNGWSEMAAKLTQTLKVTENEMRPVMKPTNTLSMCGYQAIVPLYLQGAPNNMVNKKMMPIKQKVVTINKSIDYSYKISADTIMYESVKALQIIKKLEAQGLRTNLNIVFGATKLGKTFVIKVRIKSANEKLNISKVAFPLVHPSMLRRLFLRWAEVYPNVTKAFTRAYGHPLSSTDFRVFFPNDYLLPNFIQKDVHCISNINDLENI